MALGFQHQIRRQIINISTISLQVSSSNCNTGLDLLASQMDKYHLLEALLPIKLNQASLIRSQEMVADPQTANLPDKMKTLAKTPTSLKTEENSTCQLTLLKGSHSDN